MPSRLRLFVKKRGTRRTVSRWTALVGEAAVFTSLFAIGAYGLYWLLARILLAENAAHGWWTWLAILIPIALMAYGATELVLLLWQSSASSERRAAVVQKATGWELPGTQPRSNHPALPTVPASHAVTDSPGVRLAYRLPIDAASGWIVFSMAAVCLAWNALVVLFVVQFVYRPERPNWLLIWLMVPLVLAGIWTLVALVRQVLFNTAMGITRLEVSQHPLVPGEMYRGFVSQTGRVRVRWFQVQLVCEEQAIYQQGTDTRRAACRVYRETLFSQRKFRITPHESFEAEFEFAVPITAMHSFVSPHNAIIWSLVARGRMARWGDFERRFPVYVYPNIVLLRSESDAPPARVGRVTA
jgi:hypothetical protein